MKSKQVRAAYHHGDLKNALMETALVQISRTGVRALSLRDVARRSGVSHTASYRHFSSKESLLAAIAEQGFRRLSAAMRAATLPHADDPVAALQASGVAYVEFGVSYPEHLSVMFSVQLAHAHYPGLAQASKEAYALLTAIVHDGLRTGSLRGTEERTITLAAWSIVHGLTQLITGGQLQTKDMPSMSARELALAVTTLLHQGIV
ncbi:MAG TPA: TetR/AcrR family transcriptional regulator, partial [Steroidobacter sp.]|nr:TetR/AcrR family transcriptional regulator [Steroidobacter sp.]